MPSPNVDSAVIRIDLNHEARLDEEHEKFFFSMVKAGFSQRRKTLANALSSQLGMEKAAVYDALSALGINENVRIEALTMEELIAVSGELMKSK